MNDYKFGNFIYQLRAGKGLSQSQLGNMLGVSNKAVSKWEMGVSKPRPAMLVTLASLFGVTVEELLAGERNTEKERSEESKDSTIKLWTGEYLKKIKRGRIAVITAALLPIVLFVWVGIMVELCPTDKTFGPIGCMIIFFAGAIDIALIFVFYGSARRLKRILYSNYYEQKEEIEAIIFPKKEKVYMLKWERICCIISSSILVLCSVLRLIAICLIDGGSKLRIFNIIALIVICLVAVLQFIVCINYCIRAHKINKRKTR